MATATSGCPAVEGEDERRAASDTQIRPPCRRMTCATLFALVIERVMRMTQMKFVGNAPQCFAMSEEQEPARCKRLGHPRNHRAHAEARNAVGKSDRRHFKKCRRENQRRTLPMHPICTHHLNRWRRMRRCGVLSNGYAHGQQGRGRKRDTAIAGYAV